MEKLPKIVDVEYLKYVSNVPVIIHRNAITNYVARCPIFIDTVEMKTKTSLSPEEEAYTEQLSTKFISCRKHCKFFDL